MNLPFKTKALKYILCSAIILLIGYYIGMRSTYSPSDSDTHSTLSLQSECKLNIAFTGDEEFDQQILLSENTSNTFRCVSIRNLSNAYIQIGENIMLLNDALAQHLITREDIRYFARTDAENGYCYETHDTRNGLTHFTYHYPDFALRIVYDVYVTPNAGEDLIEHIVFFKEREGYEWGPYTDFYDENGRTDLEDWGLTFETMEATPTGITIKCQQTGGQQIGQLSVDWYYLIKAEGGLPEGKNPGAESPSVSIPLTMNGETAFTIDWSEYYDSLPPGNYCITLNIIDHFEESQVHPLTQDFHDWQVYDVIFSIQ